MVSTPSTVSAPAPPNSLQKLIVRFAAKELGRDEMQQILTRVMEISPEYRETVVQHLERELEAQRISTADYKELLRILSGKKSENIPTRPSEELPAEPGVYTVDGEGTLVLSEDFQPPTDAPEIPAASTRQPSTSQPQIKPPPAAEEKKVAGGLDVGHVLRERYRLDEEVASGSMGLVYRATDLLKLDAGANFPVVAVKIINPEFANDEAALKSFQNEVANTQHLSHPHIVHLFELDRDNDHYFITMEWLEGEALDALLDRSQGSALAPVQAYAIIEQLCDALSYAHEQNVVHADVKPGNVFLVESGELKLIDFGIARLEDPTGLTIEKDQDIALTPAYASCECLEKQKPTAQDDLFSLACLIYRLLSGRRVFGSSTALQAEVQGDKPVPIGGISDSRWRALEKALAFRRESRQASVKEFAEEFGQRQAKRTNDLEVQGISVISTDTVGQPAQGNAGEIKPDTVPSAATLTGDTQKLGVLTPESMASLDAEAAEPAKTQPPVQPPPAVVAKAVPAAQQQPAAPAKSKTAPPIVPDPALDRMTAQAVASSSTGNGMSLAKVAAVAAVAVLTGVGLGWQLRGMPAAEQETISISAADPAPAPADSPAMAAAEMPPQFGSAAARLDAPGGYDLPAGVSPAPPEQSDALVTDAAVVPIALGLSESPAVEPVVQAATNQPEVIETVDPVAISEPEITTPQPEVIEPVVQAAAAQPEIVEPVPEVMAEPEIVAEIVPEPEPQPEPVIEQVAEVPARQPQPVEPDPEVLLLDLESRAMTAMADGRLVKPEDNNAAFWIREMRLLAPSSVAAAELAIDLQNALLFRAEAAVAAGDIESALRWTGLAADNGAAAIQLLEMRRMIDGARTRESGLASQ